MKNTFCFLLLLSGKIATAQDIGLTQLMSSQKQYILSAITDKHRGAYLSEINLAHIVHVKILAAIQKSFPTATLGDNWYMVEKHFPKGSLKGVIWSGATENQYFQFDYTPGQELQVSQRSIAQMQDTMAIVISRCQNWDHSIFAQQGESLKAPNEKPFYSSSRIAGDNRQSIFYYYP